MVPFKSQHSVLCSLERHIMAATKRQRASIANILSVVTGEPRNSLLATLERGSLYNEAITDDFNTQLNAYEVVSFFESKKMSMKLRGVKFFPPISAVCKAPPCGVCLLNVYRQIVVDRHAAKLGSPGEKVLSIDSNHSEMCRFSGDATDEDKFSPIRSNLKRMVEKAKEARESGDVQEGIVDS
jgi:hypothetical protein